jgi:hypothetical protein
MRECKNVFSSDENLDDAFDRLTPLQKHDINAIEIKADDVVKIGKITVGKGGIEFESVRLTLGAVIAILVPATLIITLMLVY